MEDGGYSSPALVKIRSEIDDLQSKGGVYVVNLDTSGVNFDEISDSWPNVMVIYRAAYYLPVTSYSGSSYSYFKFAVGPTSAGGYQSSSILNIKNSNGKVSYNVDTSTVTPSWSSVISKPFSTIGSGLKVEDNALTVDTLTNEDIDTIFTDVLG